jgi:hypothetical protein
MNHLKVHQHLRLLFNLPNIVYKWSFATTGCVCTCICLFEVQLYVRNFESWPVIIICGRERSWLSFRVVEYYGGTESNHEHFRVAGKGKFVSSRLEDECGRIIVVRSVLRARLPNCGKRRLDSSCVPVLPSIRPSAWNNSDPTLTVSHES